MESTRPPPAPSPVLEEIFGPFHLGERLAVGSLTEIFAARRSESPTPLVVKRVRSELAQQLGEADVFAAATALSERVGSHRRLVLALEHGRIDGRGYLVLERFEGRSVGGLLQAGPLPASAAARLAVDVLEGLEAIHGAGATHGALGPSKILVAHDGEGRLCDLGAIDHALRAAAPRVASRTPRELAYLSPEQVAGEPPRPPSDIFSLGVLLAEWLRGSPIFVREGEVDTLLAVRAARVENLGELPPELEALVRRCLSRAPDSRPAPPELARCLEAFVEGGREALARRAGERAILDARVPSTSDRPTAPPPGHYEVCSDEGAALGVLDYAEMIAAVTLGRVKLTDAVRLPDGRLMSLSDVEALAGHLPSRPPPPPPRGDERETLPPPHPEYPLRGGAMIELLAQAALSQATGLFTFERGGVHKDVYLSGGAPEFVTSNRPDEMLGAHLVRRGVIAQEELDMALAVLPRYDGRLGDSLTALGLLEPVALFGHIADQVSEKIFELFTWVEGHAIWTPEASPPKRGFPLGLDPWRVLGAGIDRRIEAGLEPELEDLDRTVLRRAERPPVEMPGEVRQLLRFLARPSPLSAVEEALQDPVGLDRYRPRRAIRLALALDLVAWR